MAEASATKDVEASAEAAWAVVGDFTTLHRWAVGMASLELTKGDGEALGSVRAVTMENGGGKGVEELLAKEAMAYRYAILEAPLPLEHYVGEVRVEPTRFGARISWRSRFDVGNGASEQELCAMLEQMYAASLESAAAKL